MLILPAILWREIEERTRLALPNEACGLLLGKLRGREVEVTALSPGRNVSREPRAHFEIDPLDVLAAEDGARSLGLSIVGVWHSHPRGPLMPSSKDRLNDSGSWLTLIAVPEPHVGIELGCWRTTPAGFEVVGVGQPLGARR